MRLREVSRSELVEQYILENIVAARNPGDRIPSEAALSKEIGVAVPTVNKILASLTDRGILFRKKGLGTYVAEQSPKGKVVRVITQSAKNYIPGSTVNWFNYQYVLEGFSRTAREYGIITETFFFDHYRPVSKETLDETICQVVSETPAGAVCCRPAGSAGNAAVRLERNETLRDDEISGAFHFIKK